MKQISQTGIGTIKHVKHADTHFSEPNELYAIFNESPAAFAVLRGKKHNFILANPSYKTLFNLNNTDFIGKTFKQVFPKLVGDGLNKIFDKVYNKGSSYIANEFPALCDRKGIGKLDKGFFNFVAQPIKLKSGKVKEILIHAFDVTEQVEASQKVDESQKYFRSLIENSTDAISLRDADGKVMYVSPAVTKIFGYGVDEYKAMKRWKIIHPVDVAIVKETYRKIYLHPAKPFRHQIRMKCKDGSWLWIEGITTNLLNDPIVKAVVVNFRDITPLKKAEETVKANEHKLQLITDAVPTLISYVDSNEQYRFSNKAYRDWFGRSKEELDGMFVKEVVGEHAYKTIQPYIQKALAGKTVTYENFISYREGKEKYVIATYIPHMGKQKKVLGFYAIITDITSRKKVEDKLIESEKRFRRMTDSAPVMVWMADSKQNFIYFNKVWYDFTGRNMKEELGLGWTEGIHQEDRQRVIEKYMDAFIARKEFKLEYRLRHIDGAYRWVLVHGTPLLTNNGLFTGYIGSAIDISERIELEQRKDDFLSIASHELKTPVTSIKAYTQVLNHRFQKAGDMRSAELALKMDNQVSKLTHLINDLLDVTKIEAGKLLFQKEYFDFNELMYEVIEEVQRTTVTHKIISKLNHTKTIYGDRDRIGQVLTNLITNAIKYSPRSNKIIVKTILRNNEITTSVEDFGVGIPKHKQNKIFDRFFRVDESEQRSYPGLGLGLFISSDIIKRHHGKIWFISKRGKGSTFFFSLPIQDKKESISPGEDKFIKLSLRKDET